MSLEDQRVKYSGKKQMIVSLHEKDTYKVFLDILSEKYQIVRVETLDSIFGIIDRSREMLAGIVIDAKRAIADGFFLHKKMEKDMRFAAIPTIAVTDSPSEADLNACIEAGMDEYITLPCPAAEIRLRVNNALRAKDSATFSEIEEMLKQLPSNIYLKDAKGRYVFATHYWHHLQGAGDPGWTIRGKTDLEIRTDKENAKLAMKSDLRMLETGEGTSYIIEEKDGDSSEYLELIKRPVYDEDGNVNGIIALINDVTEFQMLKMELDKRSKTDSLTGLLNKGAAEEVIRMVLDDPQITDRCALMMIDLDHFKEVNDSFGHAIGDQVLQALGQVIHTTFKGMDVTGRFGGDEFVVFLRQVDDARNALYLAERLNDIMKHYYDGESLEGRISLSIGIAMYPGDGKTFDELLEKADEALYYVKKHGRASQKLAGE